MKFWPYDLIMIVSSGGWPKIVLINSGLTNCNMDIGLNKKIRFATTLTAFLYNVSGYIYNVCIINVYCHYLCSENRTINLFVHLFITFNIISWFQGVYGKFKKSHMLKCHF